MSVGGLLPAKRPRCRVRPRGRRPPCFASVDRRSDRTLCLHLGHTTFCGLRTAARRVRDRLPFVRGSGSMGGIRARSGPLPSARGDVPRVAEEPGRRDQRRGARGVRGANGRGPTGPRAHVGSRKVVPVGPAPRCVPRGRVAAPPAGSRAIGGRAGRREGRAEGLLKRVLPGCGG